MSSAGQVGEARRPRLVIKINGVQTLPLSAEVVNNSHFQCDTFKFEVEAWQQKDGFGLAFWDGAGSTQVEILFGLLGPGDDATAIPDNLQSLIIGNVDDIDAQVENGVISITGRDLTSILIDNKIAQTWPDQTASQIVTKLASQYGLTPNVTATTTPVGKYSKDSYASTRRDIPIWDYITFLAEQEGFDAYVSGTTLYFGPPQPQSSTPFKISVSRVPSTNAVQVSTETLKLRRSLTLAKDIVVTVISYDAHRKTPIKVTAKRQGSAKSAKSSFVTGSTSQNYTIRRAGLTTQQAQNLAQNTLATLSQHERTIEFTNPPDGTLASRTNATISGTDTGWDTTYWIDVVTRRYSFGSLTMTATAKNHQVESQPDAA